MSKVIFITPEGETVVVENAEGNLMSIAVDHAVSGIGGDCGGVCSCATCHVHIDPVWVDRVGPANDIESGMLDFPSHFCFNSRLGCQVQVTPALDGLVVRVVGR